MLELLHGSNHIIKKPLLKLGKLTNDYGQGFYCTTELDLAKEWACKDNSDGYVNKYKLDETGLKILNLLDGKHTVLNWLALLLEHRIFNVQDEIAKDAKEYIIRNFSIDISSYDIVIGYRADDSYFSFAQSFINNTLPLKSLSKALKLGKLGIQIVLLSNEAFSRLSFASAIKVNKEIYFQKFKDRDDSARLSYKEEISKSKSYQNDLFVLDILREKVSNDDTRIQRIVLE